jgi:hypothetical protein
MVVFSVVTALAGVVVTTGRGSAVDARPVAPALTAGKDVSEHIDDHRHIPVVGLAGIGRFRFRVARRRAVDFHDGKGASFGGL